MAQVLRQLPSTSHPDLLVGPEHYSDAGIFRLRDDLAIVQTTDFFPPLVDDPYAFGQIAAANSLSDCYAMGATPVTCLNIVGFPDKSLPIEILDEILRGGADKVAESGAVIVGGHSVRDAEIKYGLAVTGVVDPRRYLTNQGARPGDALILTKPIGTGVLVNAAKSNKIAEADLADVISSMTQLNATAAKIARQVETHAMTDITGFGLLGHAFQMAEASGVCMELIAIQVPLFDRVLELADSGVLTGAAKATLENLGDGVRFEGVELTRLLILADAQTSGGLLMAVAESRCGEALASLHEAGIPRAARIGRVAESGPVGLIVRQG